MTHGAEFLGPGQGRVMNVLGDKVTLKATAEATLGAWEVFEIEVPVGGGPPLHRHPWDEGYYLLDGTLDFDLAGKPVKATSGAFVHVPGGTAHSVQNRGGSPARYLLFSAPGRVGSFFGDLENAARSGAPSIETIVGIAMKHGIEVVPPA
jgi:quercetin dioxygenase-like cupin family protein